MFAPIKRHLRVFRKTSNKIENINKILARMKNITNFDEHRNFVVLILIVRYALACITNKDKFCWKLNNIVKK